MSKSEVSGQFEGDAHQPGFYPTGGRKPPPSVPTPGSFRDSKIDVVRAWMDEAYLMSLSAADRAMLPANPAGKIELTDAELGGIAQKDGAMALSGGTPVFTVAFTTSNVCPLGSFLLTACFLIMPMPNLQVSATPPGPGQVCYT